MKIEVVHYSRESNFELRKIKIENNFMWCKPKGGIWTSPVGSNYGWKRWCEEEEFGNIDELHEVEMELEGEFIIIDNEKDLDKLIWIHDNLLDKFLSKLTEGIEVEGTLEEMEGTKDIEGTKKRFYAPLNSSLRKEYIDFKTMVQKGIDAIYLTEKGQWKTRLTFPRNLYGWDCETVLILNERCIKSWKILNKENFK